MSASPTASPYQPAIDTANRLAAEATRTVDGLKKTYLPVVQLAQLRTQASIAVSLAAIAGLLADAGPADAADFLNGIAANAHSIARDLTGPDLTDNSEEEAA